MEEVRKGRCIIVILEENNQPRDYVVDELIIEDSNSEWFKYRSGTYWITMPKNRLIKIKEDGK